MADLESIQQKIIAFTPIEILTRNDVARIVSKGYDIVSLPFRGILWNLTRGERNGRHWAQFHYPLPRYIFALVITMLLTSTWLTGCAIPITYHDATTYKNLTDLKAEAVMLVETFDTKPFAGNEAAIADITLKFRKAYEYEKGKGIANSKTMEQFDKIQKLLNDDIADYRENGNATLGPKYFREAAVVLGQAFDIVIATENLKNKDKQ